MQNQAQKLCIGIMEGEYFRVRDNVKCINGSAFTDNILQHLQKANVHP